MGMQERWNDIAFSVSNVITFCGRAKCRILVDLIRCTEASAKQDKGANLGIRSATSPAPEPSSKNEQRSVYSESIEQKMVEVELQYPRTCLEDDH
eukprot:366390-Chlamydomonas_euryale.AAC.24